MIYVIVSVRTKPGKAAEYIEMFKKMAVKVRKEKGCIEYFPAVDAQIGMMPQAADPNVVTIIEKWASIDDLNTHLSNMNPQDRDKNEKDLVEGVMMKVLKEA